MGGQEECSKFDASTRTRILTPSSESLLSNHEASMVESKKRKRERGTMEDLLDESFVVKVGNGLSYLYMTGLTTISHIRPQCLPSLILSVLLLSYHGRMYLYHSLISYLLQVHYRCPVFSKPTSRFLNWKSEWETRLRFS
jgi:hypothetical protein